MIKMPKRWTDLSQAEKTAIVASRQDGMALKEIAATYGCTARTVARFARRNCRVYAGRDVRVRKISKRMPEEVPPPDAATAAGVTLMQLRECSCRWPLWSHAGKTDQKDMLFCGAPKSGESAYCVNHKTRSVPAPDQVPAFLRIQHRYPRGIAA